MSNEDEVASQLLSLQKQRASTKGNITRIKKILEDRASSLNPIDLDCRLEILNSYIKQLMAYQTEIERLSPEDNKRGELEEICIGTKSLLLSKLGSGRRVSMSHEYTISTPIPPSNRLPLLKIPKFSGKYSEYKNFITCFNTLVNDDPTLTTIEKFNHLIASLEEDALRTVKAFQVNDENYANALNRLAERYDNNCMIFQDHIASLFNLRKMGKPCASELREIVDVVSAVLDSLSHLGSDKDITHAIIIHLVLSKVDSDSKVKWDEQLDYKKLPKWSDCASVLLRRCQFLDINENKSVRNDYDHQNRRNFRGNNGKNSQFSFSCTQYEECLFCSGDDHFISSCPMFSTMNVRQRFEYIKRKGLCINCLKIGHTVKRCRASRCTMCQRPHHVLLHNQDLIDRNEVAAINQNSSAQQTNVNAPANSSSAQCSEMAGTSSSAQCYNNGANGYDATTMCVQENDGQVILATAMVLIKDKCGNYRLARALLDSGSQVNLVSEDMAQRLSLERINTNINLIGIGNSTRCTKQRISTYVKSSINEFEFMADFCIIKSIAGIQPPESIEKRKLSIPANIILADPHFNKPQKIDILIGAEIYLDLFSRGQIRLGPRLPVLQKTLLGWIVSGRCEGGFSSETQRCHIVTTTVDENLSKFVEKFWDLEEIPNCIKLTEEQLICEDHFKKTTRRVGDGRFEVRLPFKTDPKVLGQSFEVAKRRFFALERRLTKNPEMNQLYTDFMKEYVTLGHMTPIDNIDFSLPHYFIPHQCVMRAQSTTTKLRVVFDASCKTSTRESLNDILMVGPTIQNDLFSTLLKFRLNKFAFTADITKMYRQVQVHKDDRKYQLILWREDPESQMKIFELNTLTYGTAPAPFLAIRCLKEISDIFKEIYPLGARAIATDFYVDDLLTGADDIETLMQVRKEVTHILSSCDFSLAKLFSNCNNNEIDDLERQLKVHDIDSTRALGIKWKPGDDNLSFELTNDFDKLPGTKRNVLSVSSRLFDPLGLLAPIIIKAKILLQELWEKNLDWDESIPQNLDTLWEDFKTVLSQIPLIVIPRFVGTMINTPVQIHGFADASMKAYGCCIYVVSNSENGLNSRLLVAKSRVAPAKKVKTLPRLELCAAHLLAKLWSVVKSHLKMFSITNILFWRYSEIALHWVKTHPSSLTTFVSNRVAQIHEKAEEAVWRYVPTDKNPADIVSRGCDVIELNESIWLSGPNFITQESEKWPVNHHFELSPEQLALEKKKEKVALLNIEVRPENLILNMVERVSSYKRIIHIVAYILRFIRGSRYKCRIKHVTLDVKELEFAFLKVVEVVQSVDYRIVIENINEPSMIPKKIQRLNPFIQRTEYNGLSASMLRVGGRLKKSSLPYKVKFPLLLSKSSRLVNLYFLHLHVSNCHAGAKVMVGLSREEVWVVNVRKLARQIVHSCALCFRFKPKLSSQIMGDLPRDRLTACRPFNVCGVDLCGPVYTTLRIRGRPPVKTYIAVFVCFASKAVHLEALSDLSTETFLSTLNRFIGRRGLPKTIWSDNGKNFVGTAGLWSKKAQTKILQVNADRGIEFKFIPPRAPHFGGLWEAAVKSAKHLMLRTIGSGNLTFEELTTVLVDVEAVLNSRPIAGLTEDPNDEIALTPGHLLIGSSLKALPDADELGSKGGSLRRFRTLCSLKAHFWDVWHRDFVRELQSRTKWESPIDNMKPGDVVVMHEDNAPPQKWLLGKVDNVVVSADGKVRVAEVRTKDGLFRRPIHRLALLPMDSSQTV